MTTQQKIKAIDELIAMYERGTTPYNDDDPYVCCDLCLITNEHCDFDIQKEFDMLKFKPDKVGDFNSWLPLGDFTSRIELLKKNERKPFKQTIMGLDTTHNAWHGPYSSFNRWRKDVANEVGIDLMSLQGYDGNKPWTEEIKSHKLFALFDHSDCDGHLTPYECASIAEGLSEVLKNYTGYDPDFVEKTEQFRDGCADAFMKDETLHFH